MKSKPTCVWSKDLSDLAVQTVLTLGRALILKKIPGQNYVYMTGEGKDRQQFGPMVSRKRILSVFTWIISQTRGFSIPLLVRFQYDDAPVIGLGMDTAFNATLSQELFALEKAGLHLPKISCGWQSGPNNPYMYVSNLSQTKGTIAGSLAGIKIINVHGVLQQPEQIVFLKDIPS